MGSLTIKSVFLTAFVALSVPVLAGPFGGHKVVRIVGPAVSLDFEEQTSHHPDVEGSDIFVPKVPGTPHTSVVLPCDVGSLVTFRKMGAIGRLAQHEDKGPMDLIIVRADDPKHAVYLDRVIPTLEEQIQDPDQRWIGILSHTFMPGELRPGLYYIRGNHHWKGQEQPEIQLYVLNRTLSWWLDNNQQVTSHQALNDAMSGVPAGNIPAGSIPPAVANPPAPTSPVVQDPPKESPKPMETELVPAATSMTSGGDFNPDTGSAPNAPQNDDKKVPMPTEALTKQVIFLVRANAGTLKAHPPEMDWKVKDQGGNTRLIPIDPQEFLPGRIVVGNFLPSDSVQIVAQPQSTMPFWKLVRVPGGTSLVLVPR